MLLLAAGRSDAANGTRVRGHGFSFDATAVLERRALPVNGSWRVRQHARARLKKPTQLTVVECRNASVPLYADNIWGCGRRSPGGAAVAAPRVDPLRRESRCRTPSSFRGARTSASTCFRRFSSTR